MNKTFSILWIMGFLLLSFVGLEAGAFPGAWQNADDSELVRFEGEPYQRGLLHGKHFKKEIKTILKVFYEELIGNYLVELWVRYHASKMEEYIPEDLIEEMKGIAEGAGVSYSEVLIGNVAPDLVLLGGGRLACSTFLVMPARSLGGAMIYGRNLDWFSGVASHIRKYAVPMVFVGKGYPILSIGIPGMVGVLTGINSWGVMTSILYSDHEDQTSSGIPITLLYRVMLERSANFQQAAYFLDKASPRTVAVNTMLSDGREAGVLEMTSHSLELRQPNEYGLLYAANHFELEEFLGGSKPDRDYRWDILSSWDAKEDKVGFDQVRRVMIDTALSEEDFVNVQAVFMDYATGTLFYGSDKPIAASGALKTINVGKALSYRGVGEPKDAFPFGLSSRK